MDERLEVVIDKGGDSFCWGVARRDNGAARIVGFVNFW